MCYNKTAVECDSKMVANQQIRTSPGQNLKNKIKILILLYIDVWGFSGSDFPLFFALVYRKQAVTPAFNSGTEESLLTNIWIYRTAAY